MIKQNPGRWIWYLYHTDLYYGIWIINIWFMFHLSVYCLISFDRGNIYIYIYISHMILDIYILYFPMTNENIDNIDIVVIDSENKT